MNHNLLLKSIAKHSRLSVEEEAQVIIPFKYKKVKRKQFIFQEGEVHSHSIFVTEGCLRSYSIDKNGFEHILQFAPPGWWIGDMRSFINQENGTLYIDAVDDSEVLMLLKSDLDKLYKAVPALEHYFRVIAENALATYQHRLVDNLSLSAMDRYNNFCQLYPSLIQCLPQKQVAAYIGVTPEFLSKMLNQSIIKK